MSASTPAEKAAPERPKSFADVIAALEIILQRPEVVSQVRALEVELAQRIARDAEIAKRLARWIDGVELSPSTKSYLGDLFVILHDLEATPTSEGAEKA